MSYPVFLLPIVIAPGTVRMTENGIAQTLNIIDPLSSLALATSKTFYLRGDGGNDDLLRLLKLTLDTHTGGTNVYTVSISRNIDGTLLPSSVTISAATNNFSIDWTSASTTLNERHFGFRSIATTSGLSTTGDVSPTSQWVANDVVESFEEQDEVQAFVERARSGAVLGGKRGGPYDVRTMSMRFQSEQRTVVKGAPTISTVLDTGRAFAAAWALMATGRAFEVHLASLSAGTTLAALSTTTRQACLQGTGTAWHLDADSVESGFRPERLAPGVGLYSWALRLLGNVP
jgi:hypothetical protein